MEYKNIYEYKMICIGDDETKEQLYDMISEGFDNFEKDKEIRLKVGPLGDEITLMFGKMWGMEYVRLWVYPHDDASGYSTELKMKHIDKLFGK